MGDVQLLFHRSLYRPDSVRTALARFSHLSRIQVQDVETGTLVTLSEFAERLRPRLPWEVANHVLFQTTVDGRSGL